MPSFARVLEMVLRQKTSWKYDVIVIDSGSRDGTVEFAKAQENVKVIEIDPKDFGHGRTRNQAINSTTSRYVAVLTHDAEPLDENWLMKLVEPLEKSENVAGVFGRHIAYPKASPFTKRDLDNHFAGFLSHPLIVNKSVAPEKYESDLGWQQFLHFYSDNNSCLRRSVWEKIPYPDVEFAEDQIWAKQIIDEGYSKAYAPKAVVYHSHDYGIFERLQRSFDESKNFNRYFGYELCSSFFSALKTIVGLTSNDFRYYWHNLDQIKITSLAFNSLQNFSHVMGLFLGSHYKKIPKRIQLHLSRDKRLHNS
jgi:rhamnosyltransferase